MITEKCTLSNNNQMQKSYYKRSIVKYIILLTSTACILALQNIGHETAHISKILDAPFHRSSAFLTKKKMINNNQWLYKCNFLGL